MRRVLVTGTAGFIGYHVTRQLLARGDQVIGIDNLNDYYDVQLKRDRLAQIPRTSQFAFTELDVVDRHGLETLFEQTQPELVIHLAAQAGVRYSLENPQAYIDSNLVGFGNILEACRHRPVRHLVYASSSSVYGANKTIPFSEQHAVDHPVSLYAATKKANELMAHTYSHLFDLPTSGLRFFTVYGPWYRPDMALFKFTRAILEGRPIQVYNYGKMKRDFTYIDDIVDGILSIADIPPSRRDPASTAAEELPGKTGAPAEIYNIGNSEPVELLRVIGLLEDCLGCKAKKDFMPMQPGDVCETYADTSKLLRAIGSQPNTPIELGIERFVAWYRNYYQPAIVRPAIAA